MHNQQLLRTPNGCNIQNKWYGSIVAQTFLSGFATPNPILKQSNSIIGHMPYQYLH